MNSRPPKHSAPRPAVIILLAVIGLILTGLALLVGLDTPAGAVLSVMCLGTLFLTMMECLHV